MSARQVRVGDVLELRRSSVALRPGQPYGEIGIRSFGRGTFLKDPVSGASLGNKKVYEIHPGDLLVSNVFAWEGAVAVAGPETAGRIGSHRFMTWVPTSPDVDVDYLAQFFVSEVGLEMIGRASPGSAGRNRTLGIKNFENLDIPLPDIAEQRRIATRLAHIAAFRIEFARETAKRAHVDLAIDAHIRKLLFCGGATAPLGDLAEINPRRSPLDSQAVLFVPMAAVSGATGSIEAGEYRAVEDVGSSYTQFARGDVIFARITPCMQNGKSAIFSDANAEYGYGSTEFHVLRPLPDGPSAAWIYAVVRSSWFRDAARPHMTGTAGQQRVPARWLQDVEIPVSGRSDDRQLLAKITRLEKLRLALHAAEKSQTERLATLLPAARNEEFAKLR